MTTIRKIRIDDLIVNPENKVLPKLSDTQKRELRARIEKYGQTEDLEITLDNKLLDGHNRAEIFRELGVEKVSCRIIEGLRPEEERDYIISKNFSRRQLTREEQDILIATLYESKKSKPGGNTKNKTNAAKQVADEFGVSEDKVLRAARQQKAKQEIEKIAPELATKAKKQDLDAIATQKKELAEMPDQERVEKIKEIIEGKPEKKQKKQPEKCKNCTKLENSIAKYIAIIEDLENEIDELKSAETLGTGTNGNSQKGEKLKKGEKKEYTTEEKDEIIAYVRENGSKNLTATKRKAVKNDPEYKEKYEKALEERRAKTN